MLMSHFKVPYESIFKKVLISLFKDYFCKKKLINNHYKMTFIFNVKKFYLSPHFL